MAGSSEFISIDAEAHALLQRHCANTGQSMRGWVEQLISERVGDPWRLVVVESPLAGDRELNLLYLDVCLRDCLLRGDAPFASHGLYVGPLRDEDAAERSRGMNAGFAWRRCAAATVVYVDLGISGGMKAGVEHAHKVGCEVEIRSLFTQGFAWKWVDTTSIAKVHPSRSAADVRSRCMEILGCAP